ncbi:Poly [ADP-ribose] polymerase 14 [Bagarius yarrelli]|uniref:Poly [ADP-ribose] polymerase n=1 Tax=Bagarius yarrelli TaxID=175774 RepID=A0A556V534_BAGYA|nr:Poly [ADP-ribose] polymerase 14 [Bagarius yarrelli]
MEKYFYPLLVEGNWADINYKTLHSKVHIYFQSRKKSQGGDCVIRWSDRSCTVLFKSQQIRDQVLAKAEHVVNIDQVVLKLKVSKPSSDSGSHTEETLQASAKTGGAVSAPAQQAGGPAASLTEGAVGSGNTPWSKSVVLENVSENVGKDFLTLLVETISGHSEEEYSLEFIAESNAAVVTFNDPSAVEKFLAECGTNKRFRDWGLKARRLEEIRSVRVEKLPASCIEEFLELYFEKHVGAVEKIKLIDDEQAAIINFHDQEAVQKVFGRNHTIRRTPVDIYPFVPSLGSVLYGKDRPAWTLPKPFTDKIHPAIREFLQMKGKIPVICNHMSSHFCQVNMDKDKVMFSPLPALLRQKDITKKHIDNWKQDTMNVFNKLMSAFNVFEYSVSPSVWTAVEKDVWSVVKDKAFLKVDTSTGCLTLAGMSIDINMLEPILKKTFQEASVQMEREKIKTSDSLIIPPAIFFLFQHEGLDQHATAKYPQLELTYSKDNSQLSLTGLHVEIVDIKNVILMKRMSLKEKTLTMDPLYLEFLGTVDFEEMSRDLFTSKNIGAVYRFESGTIFLTASTDKELTEAEKRLDMMLKLKLLPVEDPNVLKKKEWQDLTISLSEAYNLPKMKTVIIKSSENRDTVVVCGFQEPVKEISTSLEKFLETHSRTEETIRVKSYSVVKFIKEKKPQVWQKFLEGDKLSVQFDLKRPLIRVSGERVDVQPALTALQDLAGSLYTDRDFKPKISFKQQIGQGSTLHDQKYQGNSDHNKGYQEQGAGRDQDNWARAIDTEAHKTNKAEDSNNQLVTTKPQFISQTEMDRSGVLGIQSTNKGLKIILRKANIQDACCDVIVNTVAEDLDLTKGAVSKALLNAAGSQLQAEAYHCLKSFGNASLKFGDLIDTKGYNLKCQRVFHTVCPYWSEDGSSEQILKRIIETCLKKAENQKMSSISFPAIGTGNLTFPRDIVCRILLGEIHAFSAKVSPQYLNEVTVIVHPSDSETVQCFVMSFRGERQGSALEGTPAVQQSPAGRLPPVKSQKPAAGPIGAVSTPSLGVHRMQIKHLTLEVSSGDITKERCDAIVNSSNATFMLKSGVSKAILDAAGSTVENECAKIVASLSQQTDMIMTSAGQLPCKHIIHIIGRNNPPEIKNVVYSVLKHCEEQKFSSVAFPALGTGQGRAQPSAVADAMIDALVEFVKKKKGTNLQSVKFLIFQAPMVSDFYQCMVKRQQENVEEEGLIGWFKAEGSANEEFVLVGEEFEPVVFQLCGESEEDLKEARDLINSFIVKEHISTKIEDSAIRYFGQEEATVLHDLQKKLTVSIQHSKSGAEPAFIIEGLTRDVVLAGDQIREMIRKVEKTIMREWNAFKVSSQVKWQYQDRSGTFVPFDIFNNFDLEEAFLLKQPCINISIDNDPYKTDLSRMIASGKDRKISLKRTDLQDKNVSLPSHWDDMKKKVELQANSQEYLNVEYEFRRTGLTSPILKIERIQNETLWKNYMNQKEYLEKKNKHQNNEKQLFHGTGADKIAKINERGFNRSFAGMHGAMYGNGVYFAVDPKYSANGYATPDPQGHKRIYLARVLVGDFTIGKAGLITPPAKKSTSMEQYDSVTDNQQSMFVIFHDDFAYPEYLITFQ